MCSIEDRRTRLTHGFLGTLVPLSFDGHKVVADISNVVHSQANIDNENNRRYCLDSQAPKVNGSCYIHQCESHTNEDYDTCPEVSNENECDNKHASNSNAKVSVQLFSDNLLGKCKSY